MMYQIKIILLLAIFTLVGCDQRTLPSKNFKLDEGVMSLLLESKEDAIRRGDGAAVKGFYSKKVVIEITSPNGLMFENSYNMIARQADINAEYGRGFHMEVLERVVHVSANQNKAVVQQRVRESWLFTSNFNDVLVESVNRMEWELINDIPQITRVSKRILDRTILNDVDRQPVPGQFTINDA